MIVIADDITGAAEIAGIAFAHGLQVRLVCSPAVGHCNSANTANFSNFDITVIATDTRSLTENEAAEETRRIAGSLSPTPSLLFKKTDSALRGHVVAELTTLMQALNIPRAVYLPANPSKGRIIINGTYYIGTPPLPLRSNRVDPTHLKLLTDTPFSYDPEFPATTAILSERFAEAANHHIIMPDAATAEDIRNAIVAYDDGATLFAGAADLFTAFIENVADKVSTPLPYREGQGGESTLILCGSTQSRPPSIGIPLSEMPLTVYDGSDDTDSWMADAAAKYSAAGSLILHIPYRHRTGKTAAVHLRQAMAAIATQLYAMKPAANIIIEGGATAWATLQGLGWQTFRIVGQTAPGVVTMQADNGTLVTLKPGSYPWGKTY
jgi:uncharacterized protein YgbK (DUF1537 family)